uniref:Gonadotropin subunit beta-2 n=2 Tax=Oryzias melastigma TaxID=30732 RepID=A0A3B3C5E0_ORYME
MFMSLFMLRSALVLAVMAGAVCACVLKNHTIWVEKQNCTQCMAINTTICSGYCYSRDTNLRGRFGRTFLIQRSCMPLSLVYRVAHIPGCPPDVNAELYYPVAHCCSCRCCDTRTYHCVQPRRFSYDQCSVKLGNYQNQNCSGNLTNC